MRNTRQPDTESSTGDRDATRAAVWVVESEDVAPTGPALPSSLFDDPVKLAREMRATRRSLAADQEGER